MTSQRILLTKRVRPRSRQLNLVCWDVLKLSSLLCLVFWCRRALRVSSSSIYSMIAVDSTLPPLVQDNNVACDRTEPYAAITHPPLLLQPERVPTTNHTGTILQLATPFLQNNNHNCFHKLSRTFWEDGYTPLSNIAKWLQAMQANCSLPTTTYYLDNVYGLGSHVAVWSQALCNAHESNARLSTVRPNWLWADTQHCPDPNQHLTCYFGTAIQPQCKEDPTIATTKNVSDPKRYRCAYLRDSNKHPQRLSAFRGATTEFLFHNLSNIVVQEAERQYNLHFPKSKPSLLITVHIRHGDKFWEMDLVAIEHYIAAVHQHLDAIATTLPKNTPQQHPHIYLATEDPAAAKAFVEQAPQSWTIVIDSTVTELNRFRPLRGNRASWTARNTRGKAGLVALGSLLVALEADYFVLTTASNWSRLMDQLRTMVVDRFCGNCTRMIDLRPGEW